MLLFPGQDFHRHVKRIQGTEDGLQPGIFPMQFFPVFFDQHPVLRDLFILADDLIIMDPIRPRRMPCRNGRWCRNSPPSPFPGRKNEMPRFFSFSALAAALASRAASAGSSAATGATAGTWTGWTHSFCCPGRAKTGKVKLMAISCKKTKPLLIFKKPNILFFLLPRSWKTNISDLLYASFLPALKADYVLFSGQHQSNPSPTAAGRNATGSNRRM